MIVAFSVLHLCDNDDNEEKKRNEKKNKENYEPFIMKLYLDGDRMKREKKKRERNTRNERTMIIKSE